MESFPKHLEYFPTHLESFPKHLESYRYHFEIIEKWFWYHIGIILNSFLLDSFLQYNHIESFSYSWSRISIFWVLLLSDFGSNVASVISVLIDWIDDHQKIHRICNWITAGWRQFRIALVMKNCKRNSNFWRETSHYFLNYSKWNEKTPTFLITPSS